MYIYIPALQSKTPLTRSVTAGWLDDSDPFGWRRHKIQPRPPAQKPGTPAWGPHQGVPGRKPCIYIYIYTQTYHIHIMYIYSIYI